MADAASEAATPGLAGPRSAIPSGPVAQSEVAALQPGAKSSAATAAMPASPAESTSVATVFGEGDTSLPEQIAYLPTANPLAPPAFPAQPVPTAASPLAAPAGQPQPLIDTAPLPTPAPVGSAQSAQPAPKLDNPVYVTATDPQAAPAAKQKRSFLSSLFGSEPVQTSSAREPAPIVTLASTGPARQVLTASVSGPASADNALPGVRQSALFEIKRKSGLDDDSDVDLHEDEEGPPIRLASAAGLARLAPNGLLTQTEAVDVACLKPSLVRVLQAVERHYGRKVVVTSGYRSPSHNRRARGAKNSLHMYCAAADVQVEGVSKWELASFVRSMPGRGGVGTYCHTESVHIDVGPERDWNWRCRRRNG
ncbi:MAG TPA: DUF882 domain-containing protein [Rhizobiales bacterium]|nr:DUF882 domain-containing protein [Hyphomicrobiales bacterium]